MTADKDLIVVFRYIEETYSLPPNASNAHHLASAIKRGEEKGIFYLPKGIGGKVKMISKKTAEGNKEVCMTL
jgi:histone H1/5